MSAPSLGGGELARLSFMFFSGATAYVLKDWIRLSGVASMFLLAVLAVLAFSSLEQRLFYPVYALSLAYLLLCLAYLPGGGIRRFNGFGDYSYGIYIYAFPVQQAVVASLPGVSVAQLFLVSGGITLVLAMLSWHLLEQRALNFKDAATDALAGTLGGLGRFFTAQARGGRE